MLRPFRKYSGKTNKDQGFVLFKTNLFDHHKNQPPKPNVPLPHKYLLHKCYEKCTVFENTNLLQSDNLCCKFSYLFTSDEQTLVQYVVVGEVNKIFLSVSE